MSDRAAAAVAAVVVVAFRAVLAVGATNPHLLPDEIGYLGAARRIAGVDPAFVLGPAPRYHPLYGAVLAPVFWLTDSPGAAYAGAMVLNVLLGGLTAWLLYRCCRVVLDAGPVEACVATVAAGVYAGASVATAVAWAENLLPACVLAWVLAMARRGWRPDALAVLAALASYLAHPRGLLVVVVTVGAALWTRAWTAGAAAVVGYVAARLAIGWLLDPLYDGASERLAEGGTLRRLLQPDEWPSIAERVAGEAWYQSVATAGVVVAGCVALWRRAPALLAVVAGLAVAAGAYLGDGDRTDALFYGRYVDAATPLVLAAGVVSISRVRQAAVPGVATLVASTLVMVGLLGSLDPSKPLVDHMVLGVAGHIGLVGLRLVPIALVGAAVIAAAVAARRWAGVVLVVAFAALAVEARHDRLPTFVRYGSTLEDLAVQAAPHRPVAVDLGEDLALFGYQWFAPGWVDDPRPWLVAPLGAVEDRTLVAVDPSRPIGLWTTEPVDASLPEEFPGPFDQEATSSVLRARLEGEAVVVSITNATDATRWPRFDPRGAGGATGRVRVGVELAGSAGVGQLAVADLPRDLLPGESVDVQVDVAHLLGSEGDLVVDLFQVEHGWFRERGHEPALVRR